MNVFDNALLTVAEMGRADALAVEAGILSLDLMEKAGAAVTAEIKTGWAKQPIAVLCGPGNNGGDGFVVARLLKEDGWPVRLALLGSLDNLKGDAAVNAERWGGPVEALDPSILADRPLVVDALFGAGLARPLEGPSLAIVETINTEVLDCIAVDMPSGVHGDSGEILGDAPRSKRTVSFFRAKPGHWLQPGRERAGDLVIADIGIPEHVLGTIAPSTFINGPGLWGAVYPWPSASANKYDRGHAVIVGGGDMTGAARLVARGARRIGAGLVTIASPPDATAIYAADWPGTMVQPIADDAGLEAVLEDRRKNAIVIGPGAGLGPETRGRVLACLAADRPCVIDADGLTVFGDRPNDLFDAIASPCVLTPHDGEFARLFDSDGNKLERCRRAAVLSGAVVLLKGSDTVIASPDGRAVVNGTAPPDLATGGSGDVLAGFITGLLAQGMDAFNAACAGTWLHGRAAACFGPGLIAEDLPDMVPTVLRELQTEIVREA
jgi:hydroxyethylthiazole kinase-like uncharacterized protein yjeF